MDSKDQIDDIDDDWESWLENEEYEPVKGLS